MITEVINVKLYRATALRKCRPQMPTLKAHAGRHIRKAKRCRKP